MKARLVYKTTHSQTPVAIHEIFANSSQHTHNLRNNEFKLYLSQAIIVYFTVYHSLYCD